jgi:hypothetical protein
MWEWNKERSKYFYYHPAFGNKKLQKMRTYSHFESIITNILFYDEFKQTTSLETGISILSKL